MQKVYQYGFFILLFIIATGITCFNLYKSNLFPNKENIQSLAFSKRIESFARSGILSGKIINDVELETNNNSKKKICFVKPTLLLFLSDSDCKGCTRKELEIYKELYKLKERKFDIKIILFVKNTDYFKKLKDLVGNIIELFKGTDFLLKEYALESKFPQLLFIAKNRIISAFLPVILDEEFSKWYSNLIQQQASYFD